MTEPMKIPFLNKPKATPDQPQVRGGDTRLQDYMNQFRPTKTIDSRHLGINGLGHVVNTKPAALMLNPEFEWPALEPEEEEAEQEKSERPQTDNIYVDPEANAKEVLRLVPKMPMPKSNDQEPTRDGH